MKYNEFGEVISENGIITGQHLGTPMQDALAEKPEDNEPYAEERNTVTRISNSEDTWENQPESSSGSSGSGGSGGSDDVWFGDGNTHIWISLPEGLTSPMFGMILDGTATVDWGDGSELDVITSPTEATKWTPTHNYDAAGDYIITITVDGCMSVTGDNTNNRKSYILRYSSSAHELNKSYQCSVKRIELGRNVAKIGYYAFTDSFGIESITMSDDVTSITSNSFSNCYSLKSIDISNSVTSLDSSLFGCCYNLTNVSIPESVTSIGANVFLNCYSMGKIRFNSNTPPTVSGSNAFYGVPNTCIISVPVGCLEAYTTATNYPSASTYTYIEED